MDEYATPLAAAAKKGESCGFMRTHAPALHAGAARAPGGPKERLFKPGSSKYQRPSLRRVWKFFPVSAPATGIAPPPL